MLFDGYLICSDFDGTLADKESQISRENALAIHYFQQHGGLFTLASGRTSQFIDNLSPVFVPNAPIVSLNGTCISDHITKKVLYQNFLDPSAVDIIKMLYNHKNLIHFNVIVDKGEMLRFVTKKHSFEEILAIIGNANIYKILFVWDNPEIALDICKKFDDKFSNKFHFCRSWDVGVELFNKSAGKGECLHTLKKLINKPIHTIIGVGDYENDISLVKLSDIGYAVENATESLKAVADRIAPSNNDSAIAHIIYNIL